MAADLQPEAEPGIQPPLTRFGDILEDLLCDEKEASDDSLPETLPDDGEPIPDNLTPGEYSALNSYRTRHNIESLSFSVLTAEEHNAIKKWHRYQDAKKVLQRCRNEKDIADKAFLDAEKRCIEAADAFMERGRGKRRRTDSMGSSDI